MFSTYVVASGLQYGMGEEVLHYFFKVGFERLLLLQLFWHKHATLIPTQSKRFKLKIHFFLNPSEVNWSKPVANTACRLNHIKMLMIIVYSFTLCVYNQIYEKNTIKAILSLLYHRYYVKLMSWQQLPVSAARALSCILFNIPLRHMLLIGVMSSGGSEHRNNTNLWWKVSLISSWQFPIDFLWGSIQVSWLTIQAQ